MKWKTSNKNAKKKNVRNVSCAENFFFEQDYIMAPSTQDNEAQVHNLVGTCKVSSNMSSLNLEAVDNKLHHRWSRYQC